MFYITCIDPRDSSHAFYWRSSGMEGEMLKFKTREEAEEYINNYRKMIEPGKDLSPEDLSMEIIEQNK